MSRENRSSRNTMPGISLGVAAIGVALGLAYEHAHAHENNRHSMMDRLTRWFSENLLDASGTSQPRHPPLTRADIAAFPVRHVHGNDPLTHKDKAFCVVCMEPFKQGDTLMRIPCFHEFHSACISDYLHVTHAPLCPICRHPVTPS